MAVEFDQYLQTCEISEFCATLSSSLRNIIDCNDKSSSGTEKLQAISPNKSNSFCDEQISNQADDINTTCTEEATSLHDCKSESNRKDSKILQHDYNRNESKLAHNQMPEKLGVLTQEELLSTSVAHDNISCSDTAKPTDPASQSFHGIYDPDGLKGYKVSKLNNISFDSRIVLVENGCRDVSEDILSNSQSLRQQKMQKLRQRQLSLPVGYSSTDFEHDVTNVQSHRRRHSVRFADEIGEILSTFITIPSNEDELRERYSKCHGDRKNNSQAIKENLKTENFSWANNNLNAIGESFESRCSSSASLVSRKSSPSVSICTLSFDQPSRNHDEFMRRLQVNGVCLESVVAYRQHRQGNDFELDDSSTGSFCCEMLECKVKVKNIETIKNVVARCTSNDWMSFTDITAEYIQQEQSSDVEDADYDTFRFTIAQPNGDTVEDTRGLENNGIVSCYVEFAIRYQARGRTFWDNNNGKNYRIVWT